MRAPSRLPAGRRIGRIKDDSTGGFPAAFSGYNHDLISTERARESIMPDQSLLLLLDEVRGKTLRLLHAVTDQEAHWPPPELHNHILWHAGHSFVLVESLAMEAVGDLPQIPEGWFEIFSWESKPPRLRRIAGRRWRRLSPN